MIVIRKHIIDPFVVFFVLIVFINSSHCSDRPIIGILAQKVSPFSPYTGQFKSFISASYVKALESSGARVVPVFVDKDIDYYKSLVSQLNGFLFPGGGSDVLADDGYARSGKIIFDIAMEMNSKGDPVPILGVCLGMELLGVLSAGGQDVRTPCDVRNEALPLKFFDGFKDSSLYAQASDKDVKTLSTLNSTLNYHRYCVTEKTMQAKQLLDQWKILSTSRGSKSDVFISSMEMRSAPIAAIQFHPEKNAYEWKQSQANPHDARSIAAARVFYDWLINQARKNSHSFKSWDTLKEILINNYCPTFTGKSSQYDFQDYFFDSDVPISNIYIVSDVNL